MRSFEHFNARSIAEVLELLQAYPGEAVLSAGGTDLLGLLKADCLPRYPRAVINLKTVPGLDGIEEKREGVSLGALVNLADLARSPLIRTEYPALGEAAYSVATPQIRNVATLGGNLCQEVRCWYYRYPAQLGGSLPCARKGGTKCYAPQGDNRYHALMGARRCYAVCPSDTAVALAALEARVRIVGSGGERRAAVTDFYHPLGKNLEPKEIVVGVDLPRPPAGARQRFLKFTLRRPIDFAVASVAAVVREEDGVIAECRLILGAIAPGPVRVPAAEELLRGRPLEPEVVARAAEAALAGARPLSGNAYKIELTKALVKRALLGE
ncbi:MAG: FAD binding domain-containing protein [Clostridia bacterium]|jgi:xanthine dehydrogenase YagS FAD-binding subunit|nr:FAD binding domain-containing protein [Clostridia bacterium]